MSESKTAWIIKSLSNEKPWGREINWKAATNSVKTLNLRAGTRNSFKYNHVKDEMLICGAGKVRVYYADEEVISKSLGDLTTGILVPGTALVVQSGCPYRLEAIEDSIILEVSNQRENEPTRLHDDYGRKITKISEHIDRIIEKWFLS